MERRTQVHAEAGRQDLLITREFELPVALLFRAYADAELFEQWMSTKLLQYDARQHGSYRMETSNAEGLPVFGAHGVFHEFVEDQKITRTFEMDNAPFGAQLEFLEFTAIDEDRSALRIQVIYRSGGLRDQLLKLPFAYGINMAHDRLQDIASKLRQAS
jgi:uncharacterized protein YndB with AHSA1/START domain